MPARALATRFDKFDESIKHGRSSTVLAAAAAVRCSATRLVDPTSQGRTLHRILVSYRVRERTRERSQNEVPYGGRDVGAEDANFFRRNSESDFRGTRFLLHVQNGNKLIKWDGTVHGLPLRVH